MPLMNESSTDLGSHPQTEETNSGPSDKTCPRTVAGTEAHFCQSLGMAYFKDLTPCDYSTRSAGELAVGWLSVEQPFPSGDFPAKLLTRLAELAARPIYLYRGFHECDICHPAEASSVPPAGAREVIRFRLGEPDSRIKGWAMGQRAVIGGNELRLGNGEIRICGEGDTVYVAPTMIVHYIVDHDYLPPEEFIQALRIGRLPQLPPEAFEV